MRIRARIALFSMAALGACGDDARIGDADVQRDAALDAHDAGARDASDAFVALDANDAFVALDANDAFVALDASDASDAFVALDASDAGRDASPCGSCPDGYACGSANGIDVCRAPSGVPLFERVYVIVMENTSLSRLDESSSTPYLDGLQDAWAISSRYFGVDRPSLTNYIAMTSGIDTHGIPCNCQPTGPACGTVACEACGCAQDVEHLGDQLEATRRTWRNYAEDMGEPCNAHGSGGYAPKHVPFLYYANVIHDPARCAEGLVDYARFAGDLSAGAPTFSMITPNLVNDMHDAPHDRPDALRNGDTWLAVEAANILDPRTFGLRDALFIVWDEPDITGDERIDEAIPFYLISELAKHPYVSDVEADHYALLATIEDGLGLPRLGLAAEATPMADFFPAR